MKRMLITALMLTAQVAHADDGPVWSLRLSQHLGHQTVGAPYESKDGLIGTVPLGLQLETETFRIGAHLPLSWAYEPVPSDQQGQEGPSHRVAGGVGAISGYVETTRRASSSVRVRALAMIAVSTGSEGTSHVAARAAHAFFYDPTVTWPESHLAFLKIATSWQPDGARWSVDLGVGHLLYWGGRFGRTQSVVRADVGANLQLTGSAHCWTLNGSLVVLTDVLREGIDEGYDVVPALQFAAIRTLQDWEYGPYIAENFGAGGEPARTMVGVETRRRF